MKENLYRANLDLIIMKGNDFSAKNLVLEARTIIRTLKKISHYSIINFSFTFQNSPEYWDLANSETVFRAVGELILTVSCRLRNIQIKQVSRRFSRNIPGLRNFLLCQNLAGQSLYTQVSGNGTFDTYGKTA